MDTLQLYYFSGTGNARACAHWMADEAEKAGASVSLLEIGPGKRALLMMDRDEPDPDGMALFGFLSPTHGFHLPAVVRSFIRRFPRAQRGGQRAFVLNTRAGVRIGKLYLPGLSGLVHYWAWLILRLKGYRVVGLNPADLPSNWLSIHPAVRKKGTELMYARIEPRVRAHTRRFLQGGRSYRSLLSLPFDLAIAPVALAYVFIGRFFLAKSFIASLACNQCSHCLESCPVGAIKQVQGRMYWTWRCESCMRCMNQCPRRAIETSHGFVALVIWLATFVLALLLDWLIRDLGLEQLAWLELHWPHFLLVSALMVLFVFLGYRLMHFLLGFRFFERIFTWTSLTRFGFWGRYRP